MTIALHTAIFSKKNRCRNIGNGFTRKAACCLGQRRSEQARAAHTPYL
jgi:hypothetical protein